MRARLEKCNNYGNDIAHRVHLCFLRDSHSVQRNGTVRKVEISENRTIEKVLLIDIEHIDNTHQTSQNPFLEATDTKKDRKKERKK